MVALLNLHHIEERDNLLDVSINLKSPMETKRELFILVIYLRVSMKLN